MKFNRKIIVTSLSTVMGLSLVGAISGTVAWYQYSTRATTSVVATSVANSGMLQISSTGANNTWGRSLGGDATGSTNQNRLSPVTFGALGENNTLPRDAYSQPESGFGPYVDENEPTNSWFKAKKGYEYIQYDIYLRAVKVDANDSDTLVAKEVYLSDITIEEATQNKEVSEALRVHINVDGGKKVLLSKSGVEDLPLYGELDLDGDGESDKVYGYEAFDDATSNTCIYGTSGQTQTADSIATWKATRNDDGDFENQSGKVLCTTKTTGALKVTITIWLEGWHRLNPGTGNIKAMWDPTKTVDARINVGLTFDVGRNAFAA